MTLSDISDLPDYDASWSALIISLLTLLAPQPLVQPAAVLLSDAFGVDQETQRFMTRYCPQSPGLSHLGVLYLRQYIPHITAAFAPVDLPISRKIQLFLGTMQTVKKLVYAFLFQEGTFQVDLLTSPPVVQLGAALQSPVNLKLGLPTSLPNLGGNLGPGLGKNDNLLVPVTLLFRSISG